MQAADRRDRPTRIESAVSNVLAWVFTVAGVICLFVAIEMSLQPPIDVE